MIWGDNTAGNGSTSNGIFWDENTTKPMATTVKSTVNGSNNPSSNAAKIAKSQTVSVMQTTNTNATSKNTQPAKSIAKTVSTTNVATTNNSEKQDKTDKGKKPKGKDVKKSGSGNSDSTNDEFGNWCSKTLAAHSNVIDGKRNDHKIEKSYYVRTF